MTMKLRSYRYKFYPNKEQARILYDMLFTACCLYNHALAYRRKCWRESRRSIGYAQQSRMLTDWRNEDQANNPLARLPSSAAQRTLRRLDNAYREFLKGKRGYPRFKAARRWNSIQFTYGNGAAMRNDRLYIFNVGMIKTRLYRPIPEGTAKALTILRKPSGWYCIIQIEAPEKKIEYNADRQAVGVDVGLRHALALSDGTFFDAPRFLRSALRKLRVEQRSLARKKRGGTNRKKQVKQVARLHERIGGQRRLWWHATTRRLVENYNLIAVENLRLDFMLRNGHLSKAAHDTGLGLFRQLLDYKAVEAGVEVVEVDAHNTSQACSNCGSIVAKELNERMHKCPDCGLMLDRDVNAARNILLRAQYRPAGHNVDQWVERAPRTSANVGVPPC